LFPLTLSKPGRRLICASSERKIPNFLRTRRAVAAGEHFFYSEQIKDLEKVGLYDRATFRERHGRAAASLSARLLDHADSITSPIAYLSDGECGVSACVF
jgi:hypothetical protein